MASQTYGTLEKRSSSLEQAREMPKYLSEPVGPLKAEARFFTDANSGRTVFLRGVNLSGSTKQPFTPDLPSYKLDGFFDHKDVSFVGRPFPLNEADEHFARLRSWGFNFLRFLINWEAIEHSGP